MQLRSTVREDGARKRDLGTLATNERSVELDCEGGSGVANVRSLGA